MGTLIQISPAIQSLYDTNCIQCHIFMRSLMSYLCVVGRNCIAIQFSEKCTLLFFCLITRFQTFTNVYQEPLLCKELPGETCRIPSQALPPPSPAPCAPAMLAPCCSFSQPGTLLPQDFCFGNSSNLLFAKISAKLIPPHYLLPLLNYFSSSTITAHIPF